MDNYVIIGSDGVLGYSLTKQLKNENMTYKTLNKKQLDISEFSSVSDFISGLKDATIINCAAFMPADKCELDPDKSRLINRDAVENLAKCVEENRSLKLINFSTDFVFSGKSNIPYEDSAETNPLSVYGKDKAESEKIIKNYLPDRGRTLRISSLVAISKDKKTFIEKILVRGRSDGEVSVIDDLTISVSTERLVFEAVLKAFDWDEKIANVVHEGSTTWFELAAFAMSTLAPKIKVNPINSKSFKVAAPRAPFSVLNPSENVKRLDSRNWREAVSVYLNQNSKSF